MGREVAAVRGVLASVLGMIKGGATHIAVATDHVIESFRNGLWPGYKTGEGIEPDLMGAIPSARRSALGGRRCRVADGGIRGRRRARRRCGRGRSRQAGRTRNHLHARQGPRPMCAGHAHCPTESPHCASLSMRPASSRSSASRPHPSPITWHWLAMRQTVIRVCQAGVRSHRLPS